MDTSITTGGINALMEALERSFEKEFNPQPARMAAKRSGDPLWAVALVLVGALALVGSGAFLITVGLSR